MSELVKYEICNMEYEGDRLKTHFSFSILHLSAREVRHG